MFRGGCFTCLWALPCSSSLVSPTVNRNIPRAGLHKPFPYALLRKNRVEGLEAHNC